MTIIRHTDCAVLNTAMTEAGYDIIAIETYRWPDGDAASAAFVLTRWPRATAERPDPGGPGPVVGVQNGSSPSVIGDSSRPQRISVSITPSGQR